MLYISRHIDVTLNAKAVFFAKMTENFGGIVSDELVGKWESALKTGIEQAADQVPFPRIDFRSHHSYVGLLIQIPGVQEI